MLSSTCQGRFLSRVTRSNLWSLQGENQPKLKPSQKMTRLHRSTSQSSPPVDAPDSPPQRLHRDARNAAHLASKSNFPGDLFTAADSKLFLVYHYWVHQNPGTHLDVRIEEDGKWQHRRNKIFFPPPNAMTYFMSGLGNCFL